MACWVDRKKAFSHHHPLLLLFSRSPPSKKFSPAVGVRHSGLGNGVYTVEAKFCIFDPGYLLCSLRSFFFTATLNGSLAQVSLLPFPPFSSKKYFDEILVFRFREAITVE